MSKVLEMAEAHLLNVQRELQNLSQRKGEIEAEIEKLTSYLEEGVSTVNEAKSDATAALADEQSTPQSIVN